MDNPTSNLTTTTVTLPVATYTTLLSFPITLQGRGDYPSDPPTPPCNQRNQRPPPAQGILEGARDFKIENSVLTNIQGDALMFRFEFDGPPTEEFKNLFTRHMEGLVTVKDLDRIAVTMTEHNLSQAIRYLPRAKAAYNDYTSSKRRRTACFKNTRQALLKEIALCVTSANGPRAYLLFGIAGIGKSTVAQTIAEKADTLRLLGASFFFSRDGADRRTAEKFFTSIAFQLCAYDKQFAEAIGAVLTKERGAAAISKDPQEQLTILILEPLRDIDRSHSLPTVIVVDALDECDVGDGPIILMALSQLVQELPSFRVVLTTRPQSHLQYLLDRLDAHQVFRMEDIEQKVVEGDIRLYLEYSLSPDQVHTRLPMLRRKWAANDKETNFLVKAAGQLFIIASTAVLFILDPVARNPAFRMKKLQDELTQNRAPFNALNDFYTIILRTAVPLDCERDIVERYQAVVGTIVLIEDPLPVGTLANLIGMLEDDIYCVLDDLQSVISLGSNSVPLVYHKSFPDYITDGQRCKDADLCIDPRGHHTRLATHCLHIMNAHLKRNILGLGVVSQYLDNWKALEEEQLSQDTIQQAIRPELQYASVHWAKHIAQADVKDTNLTSELKTFTEQHLLHWLEALSWIHKLSTTYTLLGAVSGLQDLNSDVHQIISDVLRLVSRDYERIEQTALCVYHTALSFTPTDTLLYKKYKHERLCQVEGGLEQWDALVSGKNCGFGAILRVAFATDNSRFASWNEDNVKLWDGASGAPIRTFEGSRITLADDFSVLAVLKGSSVTMYSVSSGAPIAFFDHPSTVVKMAISFDGSRIAAGLEDGTVRVWDVAKEVSIASLDDYNGGLLAFSPHGYMLAFASKGGIDLLNGVNIVARLDHEREEPFNIAFSSDGTQLATLAKEYPACSLRLWNGADGNFISVARGVGTKLAVSVDGSFIAIGREGHPGEVQVWSGDSLAPVATIPIVKVQDLAFSGDILAIAEFQYARVVLYDVKSRKESAALRMDYPTSLAFSLDGTRLAAGGQYGAMHLWDVPSIKASTTPQQSNWVTVLALSLDCSRLASGREDGTVELWDTNNMRQPITYHKRHSCRITALALSLDGNQLASGSTEEGVRFWDSTHGSLVIHILQHSNASSFTSLAFSSSLLAAATHTTITLWDSTSLCLIHTLEQPSHELSFSLDGSMLVSVFPSSDSGYFDFNGARKVTVWNTENLMVDATFTVPRHNTVLPSPDGSKFAVHDPYHGFSILSVANKEVVSDLEHKDLSWVPHLNGIPMWVWNYRDEYRLVGRVSAHHACVPILWIPRDFEVWKFASQSSTFALWYRDGRILLIRPPAS